MTEELLAFRLTAAGTAEEYGVEFSGVWLEGDDDAVKAAAPWIGDYVTLSRGVLCASSQEAETIDHLTVERDEARAEVERLRAILTNAGLALAASEDARCMHEDGKVTITEMSSIPTNAPQWLKDARTAGAHVSVSECGYVTWHFGTWKHGTWERGTWERGIWEHGIWKDGIWKGGIWEGGIWEGGIWEGGLSAATRAMYYVTGNSEYIRVGCEAKTIDKWKEIIVAGKAPPPADAPPPESKEARLLVAAIMAQIEYQRVLKEWRAPKREPDHD